VTFQSKTGVRRKSVERANGSHVPGKHKKAREQHQSSGVPVGRRSALGKKMNSNYMGGRTKERRLCRLCDFLEGELMTGLQKWSSRNPGPPKSDQERKGGRHAGSQITYI